MSKPILKCRRTKINWSRDRKSPEYVLGNIKGFTNHPRTKARLVCSADQYANNTASRHKLRGMDKRYAAVLAEHERENAERLQAELDWSFRK